MAPIGCLLLIVYLPVLILVRGWAVCVIWNWYVPVVFVGSSYLSITAALGLSALVGMFQPSPVSKTSDKIEKDIHNIIGSLATPFVSTLFSVAFAWFVRHWL